MSVHAEPIYWPETVDVPEQEETSNHPWRVLHLRYRVGEYLVTRLILDPKDETQPLEI